VLVDSGSDWRSRGRPIEADVAGFVDSRIDFVETGCRIS